MKQEVKQRRLENLSVAVRKIMGNLEGISLNERLEIIARYATVVLEAEVCGVHIVKREGFLSLEASFGHAEHGFEQGREFPIRSGQGAGLTGHIAFHRKLFSAHGEELTGHFAVRGEKPTHLRSGRCYSLMAIPLVKKNEGEAKLVGLLRVENKKGADGVPHPECRFTKADELFLHIFAEAVVLALDSAQLVKQVLTQKEQLAGLVRVSPHGIIATDHQGHITTFNERAEKILGYSAGEVLQRPLSIFYDDPRIPRRLGGLLHAGGDGGLVQSESSVRNKAGQSVSVRYFATWLRDSGGARVGSVGYFEDLSTVKEAERKERRFELLLKASTIVAQADNLDEGLRELAQMMASLMPHTFCRILLPNDDGETLTVKASYCSDAGRLCPPAFGSGVAFSEFPGLRDKLEKSRYELLRGSDERTRRVLETISRRLGLERNIQSLLVVPLRLKNAASREEKLVGMLEFGELEGEDVRPFSQDEIDFAAAIADRTTILVDRMRLHEQTTQRERLLASTFSKLATLFKISDYIQAEQDLDKLLHVILTGVTANYGLGLNRAALFFVDERHSHLEGRMGVGNVNGERAQDDWARDEQCGLGDLSGYLDLLAQLPPDEPLPPPTPIDVRIKKLRLPLDTRSDDIFSRVARERHPLCLGPDDLPRLPREFVEAFEPDLPFVVVPLEARNQLIGILVADNKFTREAIAGEDFKLLLTFANTAAIAIDNSRLLRQTQTELDQLKALYEAGISLTSGQDPRKVLQDIVEQPPEAAWVRVILINEMGQPWDQIIGGTDLHLELNDAIRPDGISMRVMGTGRVEKIEDTVAERSRVNSLLFEFGVGAALCFPFLLRGKPIGVVWINYDKPRRFQEFEISALQLFVNQAAIAYDRARRVEELQRLHDAARAMAGAFRGVPEDQTIVSHVTRTIVEKATENFGAESATLWTYVRDRFLPSELTTVGIPAEDTEVFREMEPRPNGMTHRVLREGFVEVGDVSDPNCKSLRPPVGEYLRRSGVQSFLGVALKVGDEPVGVLYIGYTQPRQAVGREARPSLESFAAYSALALANARLLDRVRQAKRAAEVVAKVTTLERRDITLRSIADGTRRALGCDAVVIYAYDQGRDKWNYPPAESGVRDAAAAWPNDKVPPTSVVYKIIGMARPHIAERVSEDKLLRGRFARAEKIESCVALPLRVGGDGETSQNVGVMFVNYHTRNRFTPEELNDIQLFANQAAVAIRNIQLMEGVSRKLSEQQTLVDLSRALLGSVSLEETLNRAIAVAAQVLEVGYCNIVLPDPNGRLIFAAATGWSPELVGTCELARDEGSQTGYTIKLGRPVVVEDYDAEKRFQVPDVVRQHGLKSGMSVPMFRGSEIVGAMLVHSPQPRRFGETEVNLLNLVANQTAIAIQSAQQYDSIKRQSAHLKALNAAGEAIAASFGLEPREVLSHIVRQAAEHIIGDHARRKTIFATIQLYDEGQNELVFESVYPSEVFSHLLERLGERRSLDRDKAPGWRIGITGRAVLSGKPCRVSDVRQDPDYIGFNPQTRSELVAPFVSDGKVLGVINLESDRCDDFDETDEEMLVALAKLATVAIEKARQYQDLKQVKGLVGARTALAWMGMTSSTWGHSVRLDAISIQHTVSNLREEMSGRDEVLPEKLEKALAKIERLAAGIQERNITPPLSSEEGVESIFIEDLISERLEQLWKSEPFNLVGRELHLARGEKGTVRASPAWLRRALDIVVSNAVNAMLSPRRVERPMLSVTVAHSGGRVEVAVTDNGSGIPKEVLPQLFNAVVKETKGRGMGLLLAQAIIQTYGGGISVSKTGPEGTTFAIWLPHELR